MRTARRIRLIILVFAIAVGAALAGVAVARTAARRAHSTASAYSTAVAARGRLEVTVTGTGTLQPKVHQQCLVTAGGRVTSVMVKPGQAVKAGQVLLTLVNEDLADQAEQARLELELAQMDLDALTKPGAGQATPADVAAAQAALENARLALDRARKNVDDLTVRAPFAGRVFGLAFGVGDDVPAGAALLNLASDKLRAVLSVPEEDLKHLALGQAVTVTVTALAQDLDGHITAIGAQGTSGAKGGVYYPVTVLLDATDERVRGGMTVTADVPTGQPPPSGSVTVTGTIAYDRFQPVTTPTGGTVTSVSVAEGEAVAAGQVLATLTNDQAEAGLLNAQADYARAQEKLQQLTAPGPTTYPQAQVAKARVRVQEAALKLASLERELDELTVKAAIDGTVTLVAFGVGDQVPPNQLVAAVADLSQVEAVVTVDELQVARLAPGQPATVRIDALPGESFPGSLESLSLEGQPHDGVTAYEARVSFAGDARMRTGMSLSATIEVARHENVLLVPVEAVYGAGNEASVQVLVDGKPESRPVVAGLSNNTYTEILQGLSEGETVITGTLETGGGGLFGGVRHPGAGSSGGTTTGAGRDTGGGGN